MEKVLWKEQSRLFWGLKLTFIYYKLTTEKLVTRSGLLTYCEDEINLYKVIDKQVTQTLFQRVFKLGDIVLTCRDTDTPLKVLSNIPEPQKVSRLLDKAIRIKKMEYSTMSKEMIGGFY